MVEIKKLSDRGIVKLQSLYLEVEQESLAVGKITEIDEEERKE